MFYRKNVGLTERLLRFLAGGLMVACGLWFWGLTLPGWLMAGAGASALVTGLAGFCPARALMGQRVDPKASP